MAAQSDVLLHIVDASGSIDASGKIAEPGAGDPIADIGDIEEELVMWYLKLLEGNHDKISRAINSGVSTIYAITEVFRGIGYGKNTLNLLLRKTAFQILNLTILVLNKIRTFAGV